MTATDSRTQPRQDPPRRMMAAGHVILVGLVCLSVGWLLNAAGIRKTAHSQPVGTKRDVAVAIADGVYELSHALFLDRPRELLQDAIGRSGNDDLLLSLPSPTTTPGTPESTTTTTRPAFSPAKPLRVWIGGDSLAITPGQSIINKAPATQVVDTIGGSVDGHIATGLARPEVFNWPAHLQEVIATEDPTALVLTLGSNDDQTLTGEGGVGPLGSEAWKQEYARRVGGLMDLVTGDGTRKLFLLGIPTVDSAERNDYRYPMINEIFEAEAAKRPGRVTYIDLYKAFSAPGGGYTDTLDLVRVRAADGIHFTRDGGDRIADLVIAALGDAYDLTSWQRATAPSSTTTSAPGRTAPGGTRPRNR
jgi:hypothetical protein